MNYNDLANLLYPNVTMTIDDLEKTETDNETIGILLCKTADNYVVYTSFKGLKPPIGVSKYKLFEDLPAYLTNKLNSIDKAEDNDSSPELINDSKGRKDIKWKSLF